jgi:cardiolipin synthase
MARATAAGETPTFGSRAGAALRRRSQPRGPKRRGPARRSSCATGTPGRERDGGFAICRTHTRQHRGRTVALSIAGATKSLYITNAYFAPDTNFVELLIAAANRGVDVRLLLAGPRTDVRVARRAARARYGRLFAAGVRVFEWQPTSLHAKTFVVDERWSSIGTMNFDNRSLVLNEEVTLMVLDEGFGQCMAAMFRADLERAVEIDRAEFGRRSPAEHVVEWAANLIARVL